MKICFLHIPKTAGQSIHTALTHSFGESNICPARVNDQLASYSIRDLAKYSVFSGHLDWSLLDCIPGPVYRFTVLRNPMDRILSFYFYLRGKAESMSVSELALPQNKGLQAARNLSPDEYFCGGDVGLRRFLDNHYDNFYTYYFAARRYSGRGDLVGLVNRGALSQERVLEMAKENIAELDDVFTLEDMDQVFSKISELSGVGELRGDDYKVNVNTDIRAQERAEKLRELGASKVAIDRIENYCRMDNEIWEMFRQ